jgi:hypothetical protein
MPHLGAGTRRVTSIALIALGSAFLLVGELVIYADRNVVDADRFADRAVSALDDQATRDEMGVLVAEQLERKVDPDLVAYRAIIESVVSSLADTEPFQAALRNGVAQAHRIAFGKGKDTAAVTIANFGVLAEEGLRALSPKAAKQVPDGFSANLIKLSEAGVAQDFVQLEFGAMPVVLPLLSLLLLAGGIAAANDRRAGLTGAAVGVAVVGAVVVVGYEVGEAIVARAASDSGGEQAVRSLWSAMLGDLGDLNVALCLGGVVVAGASASLLRPAELGERARGLARAAQREPQTTAGKAIRAVGLLVLGIFVLVSPELALRVVALAAGLVLAFVGASELLTLIAGPPRERISAEGRRRSVGALVAAGVVVAGIVVVGIAAVGDNTGEPAVPKGCNGSEELCDRTLDEVVFPATHNSMAAADNPGWIFPMHDETIPEQLDDGIRALLIDAYYGYPGDRVYTDFERGPNKLQDQIEQTFGPKFVAAADRARAGIIKPSGESKLYLCHGFCELGAIDLVDTLRQIDSFIEQNPKEVLLIDIEDYVKPADIVDAFERSGLADHVYDGPLGPDFPTLQELIDSGERVIVVAENRAGGAPWYRLAYDSFQETEYDFKTPGDMNCAPNRGARRNPLFLINHWINTDPQAKPSNAAKVNAHDFLLDRVRRCSKQRDLTPNVIAVDFYGQGDLLDVADELNAKG